MKYNPDIHHRRSVRLKEYDYSQPGAYFITVCTQKGECIFGDVVGGKIVLNQLGEIVKTEWLKTFDLRRNLILDEYIVMPNHFHGIIIVVNNDTKMMDNFVGARSNVPLHLNNLAAPFPIQCQLMKFVKHQECHYGNVTIMNI